MALLFGAYYCVHFTDGYSRYKKAHLLETKDEVFDKFQDYVKWCSQQGIKVKMLQCDNALEYKSGKMRDFCAEHGIQIRHSVPYVHESNGLAERGWRDVCEVTRALMVTSTLPVRYWGFAMLHAFYLRNMLPHRAARI